MDRTVPTNRVTMNAFAISVLNKEKSLRSPSHLSKYKEVKKQKSKLQDKCLIITARIRRYKLFLIIHVQIRAMYLTIYFQSSYTLLCATSISTASSLTISALPPCPSSSGPRMGLLSLPFTPCFSSLFLLDQPSCPT